jgi:predicted nuclease of predicted toxin-antitoxin system
MTIWVNAHISPAIASWIAKTFSIEAIAVRDLGMRDADDKIIFDAARDAGVVVMTKDSDFVDLVNSRGAPPQVILLACGNTSNARLRDILSKTLPQALASLAAGEKVVEINEG